MMVRKAQKSLSYRLRHWLTDHPLLKLIALLLAIIVWFYASGEMVRLGY
ncbi:MAG: hypothetical protein MJA29_04985 [Candidatus Omnitrophica bacterium]|nr:hypothetical protein [Candidatus Omnitrophota bacterium]